MLTREENEMLTQVGPGTPGGELLRRYWHPVAAVQELTESNPTAFVRILGEDLVLFLDRRGRAGLVQDHCPHRGASLLYGRVEERGIACAYHGWLYDTQGNCLETPAEPADSGFYLTVKARAHPVQNCAGLYWAYLGPEPAPVLPRYDVWARRDGKHKVVVQPPLDCNWFQAMENSVDPAHNAILHQYRPHGYKQNPPPSTTRGWSDEWESFEFYEVPFGIMKRRTYTNGRNDDHPLIFPNVLRLGWETQIRVPQDDTHTRIFMTEFEPSPDASIIDQDEIPVEYLEPYKRPPEAIHPFTRFSMHLGMDQDHMAWETQGPLADRTVERLAGSDKGVALLRQVMWREMQKVREGLDPMGVSRDPEHPVIDTHRDLPYYKSLDPNLVSVVHFKG